MKDPCIRQLLRNTELSKYQLDQNSRVVEELSIPAAKARIDIAVINGHMHGYEIKSAADNLQRLPHQIEAYNKVFDFLAIVTEEKYHSRILNIIPEWVGLYVCTGRNEIIQIRPSAINQNQDSFFLAKLLWRDELMEVLSENNIKFRKKDRNWILCETLATNINTPDLSNIVRGKLKARVNWKSDATLGYEAK
jgi:hypothetical protein